MDSLGASEGASPRTLEILIAYDQLKSGKMAKELCDRVRSLLGPGWTVNLRIWNFTVLGILGAMRAAVKTARNAKLFIVAADGARHLPEQVKRLSQAFAKSHEGEKGAMIAQLHGVSDKDALRSSPIGVLRRIARTAGVNVFLRIIDSLEEADFRLRNLQQRAQCKTAVLAGILKCSESATWYGNAS